MSEPRLPRNAVEVMAIDTQLTKEFEKVKDNPQKAIQVLSQRTVALIRYNVTNNYRS